MIHQSLNATGYKNTSTFYCLEFESILAGIISSYKLMIAGNITVINNENKIRDILFLNYLNNNDTRTKLNLTQFLFHRELPEDASRGRVDLRVSTQNTFLDTKAYYVIECKRLDAANPNGKSGLNGAYIEEGIYRFVSNYYTSYYNVNGMIGFIVEPIDIHQNITCINKLLEEDFTDSNTVVCITKSAFKDGLDFTYISTHKVDNGEVTLYHLMLDFSNNIGLT